LEALGKLLRGKKIRAPRKTSAALRSTGMTGIQKSAEGGDAQAEIEKLAQGIIEKDANLTLTKEQAVARVLKSERGKQLYEQYLKEHPAQTASGPVA